MRVLLTSHAGRGGRAVAPALVEAGHDVVTLGGHDVRARGPVARAVAGCDAVVHDPEPGGVAGTRVVLDAAAAVGARVVLVSSAAVLGPRESTDRPALTEWDGPRSASPLGDVERTALATRGVDLVVVRPALEPASALTVGRRLLDAGYPWQVLHPDDLARFLVLTLDPGAPAGLVHVAAQGTVTVAELAAARAVARVRVPARLAPPALRVPLLDTTRMHLQWGFTPRLDAVQTTRALAGAGWQDPPA